MASGEPSSEPTLDDRHDLVLDEFDEKLEAFNVLRKSDVEAADQILGQVGATDDVDRQIILELASKRLLGHPDRFPQAHAGAMRALDDPDRLLLARARGQTNRVAPGYKGNPLGFPTFILGGAFLSTIVGSLQGIVVPTSTRPCQSICATGPHLDGHRPDSSSHRPRPLFPCRLRAAD